MMTEFVETIAPAKRSLIGRTVYVPQMSIEVAETMAAVFRSIGVNGKVSPDLDAHSLDLARQYTIGVRPAQSLEWSNINLVKYSFNLDLGKILFRLIVQ